MQRKPLRSAINRKHPLSAALVAAWHFDRSYSSLTEKVNNLQVVDKTGTFSLSQTGFGKASKRISAGATDHVHYGDVLPRTGRKPYTLFAVVRPSGVANQYLVARSGNVGGFNSYEYIFGYQVTGQFGNFRSDTIVAANDLTTTTFSPGKIYRVAMSYDGTNMRTYVNGRLEGSNTHTVDVNGAANKFIYGAQYNVVVPAYQDPWQGEVFDLRIWHRCLSPNEVAELNSDPWGVYRPVPPIIRRLSVPPASVGVFGSKFHSGFY